MASEENHWLVFRPGQCRCHAHWLIVAALVLSVGLMPQRLHYDWFDHGMLAIATGVFVGILFSARVRWKPTQHIITLSTHGHWYGILPTHVQRQLPAHYILLPASKLTIFGLWIHVRHSDGRNSPPCWLWWFEMSKLDYRRVARAIRKLQIGSH